MPRKRCTLSADADSRWCDGRVSRRCHATRDFLTGLADRRSFDRGLRRAIQRAGRERGWGFALLFIDLDRFKLVNDRFGHVAGDRVLRTAAARLAECVRPDDLAARYGGDEFALLLEGATRRRQAAAIARRVGRRVARPVDWEGTPLTVTASIGIALVRRAGQRPETVVGEADRAMYLAKTLGQDQYAFFDHGGPVAGPAALL